MRIVIYSPDRHITYDGGTPDRMGVGGGITSRIRIAAALARRGHRVSVVCNCLAEATHKGVRYIPLGSVRRIECDALALHSSGGALDLTPVSGLDVKARVRVVVLSGLDVPKGSEDLRPDSYYVCSNFVRQEIRRYPFVARDQVLVTHYGVNRWNWKGIVGPLRDSRRLVYSSHPSKGLDAAREIARQLRARDARFTLHCFGGNRLWGGADSPPPEGPGMVYGGLVDQRRMAAEYKRSAFSLQLQTRLEPFGITVVEAMAAGCLVVASAVGAYKELIRSGENGFLVEGDPQDAGTLERAAELIWSVARQPALLRRIRNRAYATPFGWDTIAQVWEAHLSWLANHKNDRRLLATWARCLECGAESLALADGYHCVACGYFARSCAPFEKL
jgi:glycosyltransferase involved in cell wall biosynthesis